MHLSTMAYLCWFWAATCDAHAATKIPTTSPNRLLLARLMFVSFLCAATGTSTPCAGGGPLTAPRPIENCMQRSPCVYLANLTVAALVVRKSIGSDSVQPTRWPNKAVTSAFGTSATFGDYEFRSAYDARAVA